MLAISDVPPAVPAGDRPTYYLYRGFSMPISEWEMLTGLSRGTTSAEGIADKFRDVVRKKVISERTKFGDWYGSNTADPDQRQQILAEEQVTSGIYGVTYGLVSEGFSDDNVPIMSVDYFVTVDPMGIAESPEDVVTEERFSPLVPFFAGFFLLGAASTFMVKKGTGLKLLAGAAGGLMGGVMAVQGAMAVKQASQPMSGWRNVRG